VDLREPSKGGGRGKGEGEGKRRRETRLLFETTLSSG